MGKESENVEDWERFSVVPWGGELRIPSGQIINVIHSCTVDPFLQILYMFYSLNIHEMRKLFESEHIIVKMVREIVQMLLTEAFADAKLYWLNRICSLSIDIDKIKFLTPSEQANKSPCTTSGIYFVGDIRIFVLWVVVHRSHSLTTHLPVKLTVLHLHFKTVSGNGS